MQLIYTSIVHENSKVCNFSFYTTLYIVKMTTVDRLKYKPVEFAEIVIHTLSRIFASQQYVAQ